MIVRTYQRRNRNSGRTFSECEEESSSQEYLGGFSLGSSSQDSTSWEPKQRAKPPIGLCTSTLMEAQESGEMMEHVDEANFALDGLKPGQPLRIQRASLVSLLSIFSSAQQRRLLRTQGMAKPVIDAIIALSPDDPPTALAAAALFYVLASDGQEHLLDSAICIKFLLKLLLPSLPEASEKKASLGSKILGVTTNSSLLKVSSSGSDRGGVAIISKVRKLLSSMKEIHTRISDEDRDGDSFSGQELSSKWLALLTLEKACLSTVALEDTSGAVRRVGGHFKERLRELGGLDAVCDIVLSCFAILKEVLEDQGSNVVLKSSRTTKMPESVGLLLKCMKVMENATFLSEQNQRHLLEMKLKLKCEGSELSFIALVINVIKTLSGLLLRHKSHSSDSGRCEKYSMAGNDGNEIHGSKNCMRKAELRISATVKIEEEGLKGSREVPSLACTANGGRGRRKTVKLPASQHKAENSTICKKDKSISTSISTSEFSFVGSSNNHALDGENFRSKDRLTGSNTDKTTQVKNTVNRVSVGTKSLIGVGQQSTRSIEQKRSACFEESQDPYEFNEEELEFNEKELVPMKGKRMNKSKKLKSLSVSANNTNAKLDSKDVPQFSEGTMGLINGQEQYDYDNELTNMQWAEAGALLGDCLLSAVKVLMNLTNDNPIGCHQVAVCGGLDTMASLIVDHYPLFQSHLFATSKHTGKDTSAESPVNGSCSFNQRDEALSDQDLDLLVVILGVLVNLVEKDTGNRARLAASSVTLPCATGGSSEVRGCRRGVIALLCSIFLTRQGAGEAIHGIGMVPTEANDEAAIMQSQREAENMIVEAYAALLLGFLSKESENARRSIALCLPGNSLKVLVPILERFVAFHLSLNMISSETHAAVAEVIESCKQPF